MMMNKQLSAVFSGILMLAATPLAFAAGYTGQQAGKAPKKADRSQVMQTIKSWPETSKMAAQAMVDKYGSPQEITSSMLIWNNNGPWKRTIVYKEEVAHDFPMPHKDVLEQFVDLKVPPEKFDELAQYDGSVIVERTKGEISARCDKEEMNLLALNLANDIIQEKKSVEEARMEYGKTAMAFKKGQTQPYTQKLQFQLARANSADPDQALPTQQAGQMGEE